MSHKVIYIMGVSGSGKTTIGKLLAEKTGYLFFDADDFHSPENIATMNASIPLTDEDRWPWLDSIHGFVHEKINAHSIVLVCSALKQIYREHLSKNIEDKCRWVFLDGGYEMILERLNNREGHYMPPSLLQSQFEDLEIPDEAIRVDINKTPGTIVDDIIKKINL